MPRRLLSAPTDVQLFLTNLCNLRCIHCFAADFVDGEEELSELEWCDVLVQLKRAGVFEVTLTGGELFMRADAMRVIACAIEQRFPKVLITTTGTLMTAGVASELKRLGATRITISIDGDRDQHNNVRGRAFAFDRALEGIDHLRAAGITPKVAFTAMKDNWRSLGAVVELAHARQLQRVTVARLVAQGRCRDTYPSHALSVDEKHELRQLVADLSARFPDVAIEQPQPEVFESPPACGASCAARGIMEGCGAGLDSCCILASGYVLPCTVLPELKGGNIKSEPFLAIWRNAPAFQVPRTMRYVTWDSVPECKGCSLMASCGGGCRGNALHLVGRFDAPDPDCPLWSAEQFPAVAGELRRPRDARNG